VLGLACALAVWLAIAYAAGRWTLLTLAAGFGGIWLACRWNKGLLISLALFPTGMYLLILLASWWTARRSRRSGGQRQDVAMGLVCVYSLAAGARILAEVFPFGYAIYYNPVLFLVFVIALARLAALAGRSRPAQRQVWQLRVVLALEAFGLAAALYPRRDLRPAAITTERGTIYGRSSEGAVFPEVLSFIRQQQANGRRVLLLPEETSLYYLAGARAPARWYTLTPGVLSSDEREREYIAKLEAVPIDYILLSNRNTEEYGLSFFGLDYQQTVYQWIRENYEVVAELGRFSRDTPQEFGMLVYRRRGAAHGL
jgi:hypothetical protein